jgi:hypothetical protein
MRPRAASLPTTTLPRRFWPLCLVVLAACAAPANGDAPAHRREALVAAMAARDLAAVRREVEAVERALGDRAGVPEVSDKYQPIPHDAPPLSADEARRAVAPALARLRTLAWWRDAPDPRTLGHPLREPAEVVVGALAMAAADPQSAAEARAQAIAAGGYLLRAQREAGSGGFPFPASRGVSDAAPFRSSARFLARAERGGFLDAVVRNGWIVDDRGDGGLQFDNGECGVAMLALHAATGEAKYLEAARRAADWAITQPLAANWNYNSFSVHLLAEFARATGETRYRDAALDKARFGVIPGQLRSGRHAGRWADPHNARPAYHYIMLRSLASLLTVLPADHPARAEIEAALRLGLRARNRDYVGPGAPNKDHALQALRIVARLGRDDPALFEHTGSRQALDALQRLAAAQWRAGRAPLGPRGFGELLADTVAAAAVR